METNRSSLYMYVMETPISNQGRLRPTSTTQLPLSEPTATERIALLSERQCYYLQLVRENRSSKEIAALTGVSYRAVDKQLLKANNVLGVANRFDAARLLVEHDGGVESLHPANALPSPPPHFSLGLPLPNAGTAANMLTFRQAAAWTAIIAIVTPIGLTVAGMAFYTLLLLLRVRPY